MDTSKPSISSTFLKTSSQLEAYLWDSHCNSARAMGGISFGNSSPRALLSKFWGRPLGVGALAASGLHIIVHSNTGIMISSGC